MNRKETCECGNWKSHDKPKCFRCEDRDDEFILMDTLIAMGYGDVVPQSKIPAEVIAFAIANPRRPEVGSHTNGDNRSKGLRFGVRGIESTCPSCGSERREWMASSRPPARIYFRCRDCKWRYVVPKPVEGAAA